MVVECVVATLRFNLQAAEHTLPVLWINGYRIGLWRTMAHKAKDVCDVHISPQQQKNKRSKFLISCNHHIHAFIWCDALSLVLVPSVGTM